MKVAPTNDPICFKSDVTAIVIQIRFSRKKQGWEEMEKLR